MAAVKGGLLAESGERARLRESAKQAVKPIGLSG
jgi:hypothetical protein